MKKYAPISLLLVALTSCGTFSPNSVTIDGKTYKTGFYKCYGSNLHVLGIEARDFSTSEHREGRYHFWKFNHPTYQMYFGELEDTQFWNPTLYCLSTELKAAKQFYSDLDNYSYYIGDWSKEETFVKVEETKYHPAIEQAIKVMVTTPFSRRKKDQIDFTSLDMVTVFRQSNDGLFTTTRNEFFYKEEVGFVYLDTYFADSGDCIYYTFSKENTELLIELYKSYKGEETPNENSSSRLEESSN